MPEFLSQKNQGRYANRPQHFVSSVDKEGLNNVMDFFRKGNDLKFFNQVRAESPPLDLPSSHRKLTESSEPYLDQKENTARKRALNLSAIQESQFPEYNPTNYHLIMQ